jgi:hypothetical protein
MSSTVPSPSELKSDDGRRDEVVVGANLAFFKTSDHSFTLLSSLPSTLMARGSAALPRTVPVYLESSSVVACLRLRTMLC